MRKALISTACILLLTSLAGAEDAPRTLQDARKGHTTRLTRTATDAEPLTKPPEAIFSLVQYPTPIGKMSAYLGKPPAKEGKHPAIIWITGGFPPGGIDDAAWRRQSSANDQSAQAYRRAGLVMMYPALRGSFGNPGKQETFYGEVDDVLAAADYLAKVPYVDPERIYLGGHSTGGTLALLVAAAAKRFKAVFAFGPAESPALYGAANLTYDPEDEKENRLRAPIDHLGAIGSPTFVIEGVGGNVASLRALEKANRNPKVSLLAVKDTDHFDVLGPSNELIAGRIAKLEAGEAVRLSAEELAKACAAAARARQEASDLRTLASIRSDGVRLDAERTVEHYLIADFRSLLLKATDDAKAAGFTIRETKSFEGRDGSPYWVMFLTRKVKLGDLDAVFAASAAAQRVARKHDLTYDGWYLE